MATATQITVDGSQVRIGDTIHGARLDWEVRGWRDGKLFATCGALTMKFRMSGQYVITPKPETQSEHE